jgi:hypothetical protein
MGVLLPSGLLQRREACKMHGRAVPVYHVNH